MASGVLGGDRGSAKEAGNATLVSAIGGDRGSSNCVAIASTTDTGKATLGEEGSATVSAVTMHFLPQFLQNDASAM